MPAGKSLGKTDSTFCTAGGPPVETPMATRSRVWDPPGRALRTARSVAGPGLGRSGRRGRSGRADPGGKGRPGQMAHAPTGNELDLGPQIILDLDDVKRHLGKAVWG